MLHDASFMTDGSSLGTHKAEPSMHHQMPCAGAVYHITVIPGAAHTGRSDRGDHATGVAGVSLVERRGGAT